jgi:hypothetical protein
MKFILTYCNKGMSVATVLDIVHTTLYLDSGPVKLSFLNCSPVIPDVQV